MHRSFKVAALLATASVFAACSGGGGPVTPQAPGHSTAATATSASNDGTFDYNANPPTHPFGSSTDYTTNALPPPSLCVSVYGLTCYTAKEIRSAYNVPANYDGTGQTIVIIDAFGSPTIQRDLAYFDAVMGLPNPTLNVIYPTGQPTTVNGNWAGETSLDVEWAHAIAPKATIDLVIAPTNSNVDLHAAQDYAVQNHLGNVISMSYGANEISIPGGASNKYLQHADATFQQAKDANITVIASAGDYGASNGTSQLMPEYPSTNPLILSVGGTSLFMSDSGAYQKETVWNDTVASLCPFGCAYGPFGATGGAPSYVFKAPSYQQLLAHSTQRTTADVSYNASVYTAVLVAESFGNPTGTPGLYFVGGTSSGAPQWAGIIALADQAAGHPLGFVNQDLYAIAKGGPYGSAFHDVTVGDNALFSAPGEQAGPGYDIPTGLGSPNVANLIPALLQARASGF